MSEIPPNLRDLMIDRAAIVDLRNRIKYYPPTDSGIAAKHEDFREAIFTMEKVIVTLIPKGREQDLALTKLEELMF